MSDDLAAHLRYVKERSGYSLRRLEHAIHVSSSSLSRYLTGQAVPPWPIVVALCRLAEVDPRPLRTLWAARSRTVRTIPPPPPPVVESRNDLPLDVATFTGREPELATVLGPERSARVIVIDGMPGVGKTALAVHAAHRLTADFPDAQLYLDLYGFTAGRRPAEPAEGLRSLLTALDVPQSRLPETTEERAALWRAELADRRVVVVLDNAVDAAHVRPLLPGAGDNLVLVTSRRRLVDLESARPVSLDVLAPEEATGMFAAALGDDRASDSTATAEVVRRCGRLPLALSLAAARLRHRPAWSVDTLLEVLGDEGIDIADVLSMSVQPLGAEQQRMFRLVGLIPGRDIDAFGAAALAGVPLPTARRLLDDLVDANLVESPLPRRYRQHDLVREYARGSALTIEALDAREAALTRLLDHYLDATVLAADLQYPHTRHLRPRPVSSSGSAPPLATAADARTWLDAEGANLMSAVLYAADSGCPEHTTALTANLHRYLRTRGDYEETLALSARALEVAQAGGDRTAEIQALVDIGWTFYELGRLDGADEHSHRALELCRVAGDRYGEALALANLGYVLYRRGRYDQAYAHHRQVLKLCTELDEPIGIAAAETSLGLVDVHLERYEEACERHRRAADLYARIGNDGGAAMALGHLGRALRLSGEPGAAIESLHRELEVYERLGYRAHVPDAHDGLARAHLDAGEIDRAREHAKLALDGFLAVDRPEAEDMLTLLDELDALDRGSGSV